MAISPPLEGVLLALRTEAVQPLLPFPLQGTGSQFQTI